MITAPRPAVRSGRWLVDDLQMGRADLVILSRSLHDRADSVSVLSMPTIQLRRGPLGWFGAVDVGRVGHGGHARFLGHARECLGRDGRIVAAAAMKDGRRGVRSASGPRSG